MDHNSEQLEIKKILVDLEDEHKHLQESIGHLEHEIKKRELDIQKLVAERELEIVKSDNQEAIIKNPVNFQQQLKLLSTLDTQQQEGESEFVKEVGLLINKITNACEEVSSLIKL